MLHSLIHSLIHIAAGALAAIAGALAVCLVIVLASRSAIDALDRSRTRHVRPDGEARPEIAPVDQTTDGLSQPAGVAQDGPLRPASGIPGADQIPRVAPAANDDVMGVVPARDVDVGQHGCLLCSRFRRAARAAWAWPLGRVAAAIRPGQSDLTLESRENQAHRDG